VAREVDFLASFSARDDVFKPFCGLVDVNQHGHLSTLTEALARDQRRRG